MHLPNSLPQISERVASEGEPSWTGFFFKWPVGKSEEEKINDKYYAKVTPRQHLPYFQGKCNL